MRKTLAALPVIFGCVLPLPAAASFVDYRFGENYVVIGADSRMIDGTTMGRISDRDCKITILDDAHFFNGEGVRGFIDHPIGMAELARQVFDRHRNGSSADLLREWMVLAGKHIKDAYSKHQEDIPAIQAHGFLPLTKGFFGEVRPSGSGWSAGVISMNPDHAWDQDTALNIKRRTFTSQSDDAQLAASFFDTGPIVATESIDANAATMQRLVQFVIDNSPHSYTGGEPEVVVLEYGKPVHWYAGGDICGGK